MHLFHGNGDGCDVKMWEFHSLCQRKRIRIRLCSVKISMAFEPLLLGGPLTVSSLFSMCDSSDSACWLHGLSLKWRTFHVLWPARTFNFQQSIHCLIGILSSTGREWSSSRSALPREHCVCAKGVREQSFLSRRTHSLCSKFTTTPMCKV